MRVNKCSVRQLFGNSISYRVPPFQRAYSWSKSGQWEPLWEDVKRLAERHCGQRHARPHFMGSIVLCPIATTSGEVQRISVIDGQQRLVTIQLLLAAVKLVFCQKGETDRAKRIQDMIGNQDYYAGSDRDNLLKVRQSSPRERTAFHAIMQAEVPDGTGTTGLHQAFRYFHKTVTAWLKAFPLDLEARAASLEAAVLDHLHFVSVDLDEGENPYLVFSTLNERGVTLGASDLIKSMLMHHADVNDCEDRAAHIWGLFEQDEWWRRKTGENIKRTQSDRFFDHWLIVRRDGVVHKPERLPLEFNLHIEDCKESDPALDALVLNLRHGAGIYRQIQTADSSDAALNAAWLRMHDLNIGAPMSFMLWLFMQGGTHMAQRGDIVGVIESYIVRRKLLGRPTKQLPGVFVELLRKVSGTPNVDVQAVVVEHLAAQTGNYAWPSDNDVVHKLIHEPMAGPNKVRKSILLGVEEFRRGAKSEPLDPAGKFTVEHIMPQQWTQSAWPMPASRDQGGNDALRHLRERKIESLGNLTLVTQKLNSTTGNKPWSNKQKELAKHSSLFLNRDLLRSAPATWNEQAIDHRSRALADLVVQAWPLPV